MKIVFILVALLVTGCGKKTPEEIACEKRIKNDPVRYRTVALAGQEAGVPNTPLAISMLCEREAKAVDKK